MNNDGIGDAKDVRSRQEWPSTMVWTYPLMSQEEIEMIVVLWEGLEGKVLLLHDFLYMWVLELGFEVASACKICPFGVAWLAIYRRMREYGEGKKHHGYGHQNNGLFP